MKKRSENSDYTGYSRSDVLKKPTTMSATISLHARKNNNLQNPANTPDDSQSTPFPKAYNRAKEFLKVMLRNEIDLTARDPVVTKQANINPLIQDLGPPEVVNQFRKQLLAYARNEWPFTNPITGGNTLAWWESLERHPHAQVLAVSHKPF